MVATAVKSRSRTAETLLEWWSPQQAITMILTGDEVAADGAVGWDFAEFAEEMRRRGLAEWIGQAMSELRAAVLHGAGSEERVDRTCHVTEDAPCAARGLPGRGSVNTPQLLDAAALLCPGDFSASKLMPLSGEIVFGAANHVEWRALEFERFGVQRAARWARREGWLNKRIENIGVASQQRRLDLLAATHAIMARLHPLGGKFAAMHDRSPRLLADIPPLWLVRQEASAVVASALWRQSKSLRSRAEELLLTWLGEGCLSGYAKDQKDGLIARGVWVANEDGISFESSTIFCGETAAVNVSVINSELLVCLDYKEILSEYLRNSHQNYFDMAESILRNDPLAPFRKLASALHLSERSRPAMRAWKLARGRLGLPLEGKKGRRPLKNKNN